MPRNDHSAAERVYAGGLSHRQAIAWRNAVFAVFTLCGTVMASWLSRIPAVRDLLGASTLQVGLLLFGTAIGSIIGLLISSHLIARIGTRATIAVTLTSSAVGMSVAAFGITVFGNMPVAFAGLAVFGAGFAICDVAMNVSGAANERVIGRTLMPLFHAFFSFGTMIGAALGALAESVGVPVLAHILIVAGALFVATLVTVQFLGPDNVVEDGEEAHEESTWRSRLAIWGEPRTLLIGLIVLGMAFAEGSANDWLALAMVDGHGVDNATGAIVFGVFVTAMTVGRLVGGSVLDRFGRVPVLRASALFAVVGLSIVIFVPNAAIAVIGVVFWGLGSALGFPVGMSAAADDPAKAAARVSAVATIGYCAFLIGPPLLGFLGDNFGLRIAFVCVLVLVMIAGIASPAAAERPRAGGD